MHYLPEVEALLVGAIAIATAGSRGLFSGVGGRGYLLLFNGESEGREERVCRGAGLRGRGNLAGRVGLGDGREAGGAGGVGDGAVANRVGNSRGGRGRHVSGFGDIHSRGARSLDDLDSAGAGDLLAHGDGDGLLVGDGDGNGRSALALATSGSSGLGGLGALAALALNLGVGGVDSDVLGGGRGSGRSGGSSDLILAAGRGASDRVAALLGDGDGGVDGLSGSARDLLGRGVSRGTGADGVCQSLSDSMCDFRDRSLDDLGLIGGNFRSISRLGADGDANWDGAGDGRSGLGRAVSDGAGASSHSENLGRVDGGGGHLHGAIAVGSASGVGGSTSGAREVGDARAASALSTGGN